jgi:hypothetical protein
MFGVFSAYEQQVLRDWITGAPGGAAAPRVPSHRARQRTLDQLGANGGRGDGYPLRGLIRRHPSQVEDDADNELRLLEERVAGAAGRPEAMDMLAKLMSPAAHHSAVGLMATRMYSRLLDA